MGYEYYQQEVISPGWQEQNVSTNGRKDIYG